MLRRLFFGMVAVALAAASCHRSTGAGSAPDAAVVAAIDAKAQPAWVGNDDRGRRLWQEERRFYRQRDARLAWSDGDRFGGAADSLIRAVRAADRDGLEPTRYRIDRIEELRRARLTPAQAADIDLQFTYAYLSYAWDLSHGISLS